MTKALSVVAFFSLLAACGPAMRDDDDGTGDDGTGDGSNTGGGSGDTGEARQCDKMDIIFVVDDSGSMMEVQANLASNFPMFAQLLDSYTVGNGQPLDYRIAVTTTGRPIDYTVDTGFGTVPEHETGPDGAFLNNCNNTKRWLDKTDANMASTLGCRANVGTSGASIEMPLLMSKRALAERMQDNTNAGFIRSDALLAVVVLTDEDDASTTENGFTMGVTGTTPTNWSPQDQVTFFDQLKGNRTRWAAGVIAGQGNCSSSFGKAADGVRLKQFVDLANGGGTTQAVFSSICEGNLTNGLKAALDTFQSACGSIIL
jgi:hypothetical protein